MGLRAKILFIVALALAVGFFGFGLWGLGGGKRQQLRRELDDLLERNQQLAHENRRLGQEVQALKHRSDYLEKIAREELGLVRAEELILQFEGSVKSPEPVVDPERDGGH